MKSPWKDTTTAIGLLVLRLGFGGFMLTHGWGKLQMLLSGDFDQWVDPIGVGNWLSLAMATFAEFGCAILVMAGLLTRLAAVPLVVTMIVAAFLVHASDPWTSGGAAAAFFAGESDFPVAKEPALLYLTAFLALALTGPGRLSIDGLIWRRDKAMPPAGS